MATSVELKAKAYDLIATMEAHQREVDSIKQELNKTNQEILDALKEEVPLPEENSTEA